MNFLAPTFLWTLPFVSVPLLLHLLNRRPPRVLTFSHIEWIRRAHDSFMPKKRLRDLILLIVRTLILLLLVLFFSRPVLQNENLFQSSGSDQTMVVLVDVSASMGAVTGGKSVLDLTVTFLQNLLRKLPSGGRIGLIAYSDQIEKEVAPTSERAYLTTAIGALKLSWRPTDVRPALKQAYQMLASQPKGAKSILIVSDQAENGWRSLLREKVPIEGFDPEVRVVLYEAAPLVSNSGVSEATLRMSEEGVLKGQWKAHREGDMAGQHGWRLELNGKVVGQGTLQFGNTVTQSIPLEAQLPEGGFYSGALIKTTDAAAFDDTFYLAGRAPSGFRLLIVDGESGLAPSDSESYYLRSALESPRDPRLESIRVIRPEAFPQEELALYEVIVVANVSDLGGREADLRQWVEKGGGLFISAGNHWPRGSEDRLGFVRPKGRVSVKETIKSPDPQTPFLRDISEVEKFQWNQIAVNQYVKLEEDTSYVTLLRLSNSDPLLVRKQIGSGFVLCLTSSLDRSWTNFPAKPIFAPLVRELMATLADPFREQSSLNGFVGQPFQARLPMNTKNITVVAPDGTSGGAHVDKQGLMEWLSPTMPGLYRVKTGQQKTDFWFAINIPNLSEEGNFVRVSQNEFRNVFPKASVQWVAASTNGTGSALSALQGKDLTTMFLILLFIALAVETYFARPRTLKSMAPVMGILFFIFPAHVYSGNGNQFVYAQLKHAGSWDPYPGVDERVLQTIHQMTNIPCGSARKTIELSNPALFETPFLLVKGNSALSLNENEKRKLKEYIERGGFVFFDDTLADSRGPFSQSVRALISDFFPDRTMQKLPIDHALFRSFFLLRNVAGRRISEKTLEGLDVGGSGGGEGRTAVLLCSNDLMGAWMRDNLGQYLFSCEPGGEPQRWESIKLTLNIIYFSLTGTYKKDAIHQPFIEMKLGS